jgi:hypothetical protein
MFDNSRCPNKNSPAGITGPWCAASCPAWMMDQWDVQFCICVWCSMIVCNDDQDQAQKWCVCTKLADLHILCQDVWVFDIYLSRMVVCLELNVMTIIIHPCVNVVLQLPFPSFHQIWVCKCVSSYRTS